jgi:signal transduction histidine kinase
MIESNLFTQYAAISFILLFFLFFIFILFLLKYNKKLSIKTNKINEQEKKLLFATIDASEKERAQIAANLHDELGMMIHILKLKLEYGISEIDNKAEAVVHLSSCENEIKKISNKITNISNGILPPPLLHIGLFAGCNYLADEINSTGFHKVHILNEKEIFNLNQYKRQQAYFIIKEILNNIIKHSDANSTTIEFKETEELKEIIIRSNSKGPENSDIKKLLLETDRLGLKGMFGRLLLIDGKLDFRNDVNNQSIITLNINEF